MTIIFYTLSNSSEVVLKMMRTGIDDELHRNKRKFFDGYWH